MFVSFWGANRCKLWFVQMLTLFGYSCYSKKALCFKASFSFFRQWSSYKCIESLLFTTMHKPKCCWNVKSMHQQVPVHKQWKSRVYGRIVAKLFTWGEWEVTSLIGEERKCDLSIQSTSTKIHVSWHEGHCNLINRTGGIAFNRYIGFTAFVPFVLVMWMTRRP